MKVYSNLMNNNSKINASEIVTKKDNEILNIKEYVDKGEIYSTNEIKTSKVWVDGKPIYRKVINVGAISSNTEISVSSGLSNVNILNLFGFAQISLGILPMNFANFAESKYFYTYYHTNNQLRIRTNLNPISSCYAILEYTKTTD